MTCMMTLLSQGYHPALIQSRELDAKAIRTILEKSHWSAAVLDLWACKTMVTVSILSQYVFHSGKVTFNKCSICSQIWSIIRDGRWCSMILNTCLMKTHFKPVKPPISVFCENSQLSRIWLHLNQSWRSNTIYSQSPRTRSSSCWYHLSIWVAYTKADAKQASTQRVDWLCALLNPSEMIAMATKMEDSNPFYFFIF